MARGDDHLAPAQPTREQLKAQEGARRALDSVIDRQISTAHFGNVFHRIPAARNADILERKSEDRNFAR
jgi:hypothetical protein